VNIVKAIPGKQNRVRNLDANFWSIQRVIVEPMEGKNVPFLDVRMYRVWASYV